MDSGAAILPPPCPPAPSQLLHPLARPRRIPGGTQLGEVKATYHYYAPGYDVQTLYCADKFAGGCLGPRGEGEAGQPSVQGPFAWGDPCTHEVMAAFDTVKSSSGLEDGLRAMGACPPRLGD